MKKLIHPAAGVFALVLILTFWIATVLSEVSGSLMAITQVKTLIPWGFILLIPSIAAAGGTGYSLSAGAKAGLSKTKFRRMPVIAFNGILVLIPAALFLSARAAAGVFDTAFYAVQAVELIFGAINIVLLGLNLRDGLRMTGRLGRARG